MTSVRQLIQVMRSLQPLLHVMSTHAEALASAASSSAAHKLLIGLGASFLAASL